MKQGESRRLKPKPKKDKKSWQKRNEARLPKQEHHALIQMELENGNTLRAEAMKNEYVESGVEVPLLTQPSPQENS
jgi:hypothetical protein